MKRPMIRPYETLNGDYFPGENNFNIRNLLNVRKVQTSARGQHTQSHTPLPRALSKETPKKFFIPSTLLENLREFNGK